MNLKKYTYLGKANYANDYIESVAINSMLKEKIDSLTNDDLLETIQEAIKCPRFKDNLKLVLYTLTSKKTFQIDDMAILQGLWGIPWYRNEQVQDYLLEMIDDDAGSEYWEEIGNVEIYGVHEDMEFPAEVLACQ